MNENNKNSDHPIQGTEQSNEYPPTTNSIPTTKSSQSNGESPSKIGFILSLTSIIFSLLTSVPGLIFSIVGASQSHKFGRTNKLAIAGIVISSLNILLNLTLAILLLIFVLPKALNVIDKECERLGPGVHSIANGKDGLRKRELIITCDTERKVIDMKEGRGPLQFYQ